MKTLPKYFSNVTEKPHEKKVVRAEVMLTNFLVQHSMPEPTADAVLYFDKSFLIAKLLLRMNLLEQSNINP